MSKLLSTMLALALAIGTCSTAMGQGRPDPATVIAAQQESMLKLSFMDGVWRGSAATIKDGAWREVGERIFPGKEPVRFFEMNLKRIGDTSWPAAGAVSPK